MHKNSFLNGQRCRVHIGSAKIENLSKGWKVMARRIFLYRHSAKAELLYFVYLFCYKSDNRRQKSAERLPSSFIFFISSKSTYSSDCLHPHKLHIVLLLQTVTFSAQKRAVLSKTYRSQCKTDRQKGSFACVQRDPACLWLLWSPTLLRLGGVSQNQQLAQLLHAPCWRTASYEVLLHKSLWWCWWLGADQML